MIRGGGMSSAHGKQHLHQNKADIKNTTLYHVTWRQQQQQRTLCATCGLDNVLFEVKQGRKMHQAAFSLLLRPSISPACKGNPPQCVESNDAPPIKTDPHIVNPGPFGRKLLQRHPGVSPLQLAYRRQLRLKIERVHHVAVRR